MSMSTQSIFRNSPIDEADGIPVFSPVDDYVSNYIKIAHDHVHAMEVAGENPFIEEQLWTVLESSTRQLVEKHIPSGARVLDVGVGMGRVLQQFESFERFGIDISLDYLKIARRAGFNVAFSRIEDMPYVDEFFDAAIACDVLEHVVDLHTCCSQILRVIRPGGVLIVRVPYLDDLEAYLDESLPYEFIHLRSFDVPGLRLLFGKIHKMKYLEHTFVAPYPKDNLFRIKLLARDSMARRVAQRATTPEHPLWTLRRATEVTHEEFRDWLYNLRDREPHLLKELAPELLQGLEVNIVFRKPIGT